MATYDGLDAHPGDRRAARERSVGEHIFIWIAWAVAAAFWGLAMTTMVQIFRTVGQSVQGGGAPGAPGGIGYLVFVIVAFLVMAFALVWAQVRTASRRSDAPAEAAAAALYNSIDRQVGEATAGRTPDRRR
jgi:H+/Cl- antiporter ClcA